MYPRVYLSRKNYDSTKGSHLPKLQFSVSFENLTSRLFFVSSTLTSISLMGDSHFSGIRFPKLNETCERREHIWKRSQYIHNSLIF